MIPITKNHIDCIKSGPITCNIILFWMTGCILLGKTFSYLHVGPIFITEFVLFLLLITNIKSLNRYDGIILFATFLYLTIGTVKHGTFIFAGKDIIWLPYLFFLRFFPRNFPDKYTDIIIFAMKCSIAFACIESIFRLGIIPIDKYALGVMLFFLFALQLTKDSGQIRVFNLIIYSVIAVLIDFKTSIFLFPITPFLLKCNILHFFRFKWVFGFSLLISIVIYSGMVEELLYFVIYLLNFGMDILGIDKSFSMGTSTWRANIWTFGLRRLFSDGELFFGQFPGFNFLDRGYLGIDIALFGGNDFGIVRVAHNFIVQIIMKTGIVGLGLYLWYFFRTSRIGSNSIAYFQFCIFVLSFSSDILEVPSRGPIFYSLCIVLGLIYDKKRVPFVHRESLTSFSNNLSTADIVSCQSPR